MCPERRQEEATLWVCQACWLCQIVMHGRTLGEMWEADLLHCIFKRAQLRPKGIRLSGELQPVYIHSWSVHHPPDPSCQIHPHPPLHTPSSKLFSSSTCSLLFYATPQSDHGCILQSRLHVSKFFQELGKILIH